MTKIYSTLALLVFCTLALSQEICDNGIDDDGDGLIDLNDPDCECNGFGTPQTIPSLIPNPSFEDMNCCPSSFSQLHCADTWIQATTATSDYFNCGYTFGAASNAGISASTGTGYVGAIYQDTWKEYIGACLLSPLEVGTDYTLSFQIASVPIDAFGGVCGGLTYGDIDVAIFGSTTCSSLPVSTYDCPSSSSADWFLIGTQTYSPTTGWGTIDIQITPTTDVYAIMIGPPCGTLPPGYQGSPCSAYFFYDDLILASNDFFNSITIEEYGSFCDENLYLVASSDSIGGSWQWYKDGIALVGQTNHILDISANNYTEGDYQVRYTIGTRCDIGEHNVELLLPNADFTFTEVCQGLASDFNSQSTYPLNAIETWEWDFDGNQIFDMSGESVSYVFPSDGQFNVTLKVTDSVGCEDQVTRTVEVFPNPVTNFDIDSVCVGLTNTIQNTSTINTSNGANFASWHWEFGDGNTSAVQDPLSHLYADENVYVVKLVAESNHGCRDSITKYAAVFPNPVSDFETSDICLNLVSNFTDLSTVYSANTFNEIDSWYWEFGDGNSATDQHPNYIYTADNNYTVTLTVQTNNGCSATSSETVLISPNPVADFNAVFVCEGAATPFQDLSTISNVTGSQIVNWKWDFDDGHISTNQHPNHLFGDENVYLVKLIVESSNGCLDSITKPVEVYPNPIVDFSPTEVCLHEITEFEDLSSVSNQYTSNQIINWFWDFADGTTSNVQHPTHTYNNDGVYDVELTVITNNNCSSSEIIPVTVYPIPEVQFVGSMIEGCSPICPILTSTSTINSPGSIVDYQWFIGDALVYQGGQPYFTDCIENNSEFDVFYDVKLIATSDKQCVVEHEELNFIAVYHNPIADFSFSPNNPNVMNTIVHFTNESLYGDHYLWVIDELSPTSETHPIITFPEDPYVYNATLFVTTDKGCRDSITKVIDVEDRVVFYVPNTFTPDNDKYNQYFTPIFKTGYDPQTYTLQIFNRWGELIFESHDVEIGWDGTYGVNGSTLSKDGTYIWKIEFKETMSDKKHTYSGHVNIIR